MTRTLQRLFCITIVLLVLMACSQAQPTSTPQPTAVPPAVPTAVPTATPLPPPTAPPPPTEPPKPDQVAAGERRYAAHCGGCHAGGFSQANLAGYRTAAGLYDYIRARMPPGNPAVLSDQARYDVVAYILSRAGLLPAGQEVSAQTVDTIVLAQPTPPPGETQFASGQNAFDRYCSGCHKAGFTERVIRRYRTALGLFQFIRSSMPPGNPDVVPEQKAYDIVAYLLAKVGLIKTDQPVNANTAPAISFE